MSVVGLVITCQHCGNFFAMCKRCYRGHKYCSENCRKTGYASSQNRARNKYNKSIEAKLDHRDRNRRYRLHKNIVMDKTSKINSPQIKTFHTSIHQRLGEALRSHAGICIACKKTVFPKGVPLYGGSV